MNILSKKLKLLMESKGINQVLLGKKTQMKQGHISMLLNGKRELDDERAAEILIKGFDYKPSEARKMISEWRIEEYSKNAPELAERLASGEPGPLAGYVRIPILGDLACGTPTAISDMETPEPVDHALIKSEFVDGDIDKTYAFWAKGDSMTPDITDGSLLVVEASNEYRGPNAVHAFRFGDEYGLGRIVKSDRFYSISKANKDWPMIPIDTSEFQLCGFLKVTISKG